MRIRPVTEREKIKAMKGEEKTGHEVSASSEKFWPWHADRQPKIARRRGRANERTKIEERLVAM